GPTYGSHSDAWTRAGIETTLLADAELAAHASTKTAMTVVNPNNPDGRLLDRPRLQSLHDSLHEQGGVLIVDEAFADLDPRHSVADLAGTRHAPSLVVLRSFGK